jgi:hypothetical protein
LGAKRAQAQSNYAWMRPVMQTGGGLAEYVWAGNVVGLEAGLGYKEFLQLFECFQVPVVSHTAGGGAPRAPWSRSSRGAGWQLLPHHLPPCVPLHILSPAAMLLSHV